MASAVGEAYVRIRPDTTGFGREMQRGVRSSVSGLGRIAVGAGALVGITGVAAALQKGVAAGVNFDRAMQNVNSIAQLSDKSLKGISDRLLEIGPAAGQTPQTLAEGLYDVVSSGFQAGEATTILAASAKAASAGLTDTATSTKAIVAALNAYHLSATSAKKVSDILFQTVNAGVLTFEELAQNMGDLVPAAAPLGITLEEVGAAIATVTRSGVPAAEAATRVKNTMLQLASPSKDLKKLLHDAGYESGEAAVKSLGYAGVLDLVNKRTGGSVTATAKLFPEIRGLLGVVGVTGKNAKVYADILGTMKTASEGAGQTQRALSQQTKSASFQWQIAKAEMQAAAIELTRGLVPKLGEAAHAVARLAREARTSESVQHALASAGRAITSAWGTAVNIFHAAEPILRRLAEAAATVARFAQPGGLVAVAGAYKGIALAAGLAVAAKQRYANVTAGVAAGTTAEAAAQARAVASSEALTAATIGLTAAMERQGVVAGETATLNLAYGAATSEAAAATSAASGVTTVGTAAGRTTGLVSKLGLGLRSLVSPQTAVAVGAAALAFGIYKLATRTTEWERANERVGTSIGNLRRALTRLQDTQEKVNQLRLDIPVLRAARDQARLTLATDRQALADARAADNIEQIRQLRVQVRSDVAQLNVAEAALTKSIRDETQAQKENEAAQRGVVARRREEAATVGAIADKLRTETRAAAVALNIQRVAGLSASNQAQRAAARQREIVTPAVERFTEAIHKQAQMQKNQGYPQLSRNLDLLARFAAALGHLPTQKQIEIILTLKGEKSLREVQAIIAGGAQPNVPGTPRREVSGEDVGARGASQRTNRRIREQADETAKATQATTKAYRDFGFKVTDALRDSATGVKDAQRSLADTIKQGQKDVTDAVNGAKQNLNSLGQSLASSIGEFLDKLKPKPTGGAAELKGPLGAEFKALRDALRSGGEAEEITRRASRLSATLQQRAADTGGGAADAATKRKDRITRELTDLTALRNKHAISEEQFERRVTRILRREGINRANIRKRLGILAADEYQALLGGLFAQGRAERAGPQRRGSGLAPNIIRPAEVAAEAARATADAQLQVERAQKNLQTDIKDELKTQTQEFKKHTRHLNTIAKKKDTHNVYVNVFPKGAAAARAAVAAATGVGG